MAKRITEAPTEPVAPIAGKGKATPSRREREAANRRPIVAADRKAARRDSRDRLAESRDRARVGLANGEERYLPARDKGPQRRYARDFVDSQWTVGEFLLPAVAVCFIATILAPRVFWLTFTLYGFLLLVILDGLIRATVVRRRLANRLGDRGRVERGLNFYIVMRAANMRFMRMPKPQVKHGAKLD